MTPALGEYVGFNWKPTHYKDLDKKCTHCNSENIWTHTKESYATIHKTFKCGDCGHQWTKIIRNNFTHRIKGNEFEHY